MSENKKEGNTVKTEEQKLGEYAGQGLRGPRFGIFEQLLCQHLVQATVATDSLRKIQLICEGCLMVSEEKRKALAVDMEKVEVVRVITEAFNHRVEISNKNYPYLIDVRFGFEEIEENYNHYVESWCRGISFGHYPARLAHHYSHLGTPYRRFYCANCQNFLVDDIHNEKPGINRDGNCKVCEASLERSISGYSPFIVQISFKKHEATPDWKMFFAICHALGKEGYEDLKNNFLKWAVPFSMELMRKLTQVVRPEIYNEIAKMFVKARREEKSEG